MSNFIEILGAKVHNLKNIDVAIPLDKLTVITGVSGSGKSSLAFDIIFGEGQRRFLNSVSYYSQASNKNNDKVNDLDSIKNLSPTIAISQKKGTFDTRSTLGTLSGITKRVNDLFASYGTPQCPYCGEQISCLSSEQLISIVSKMPQGTQIEIYSPIFESFNDDYDKFFNLLKKYGMRYFLINDTRVDIGKIESRDLDKIDKILMLVDRVIVGESTNLTSQFNEGFWYGNGLLALKIINNELHIDYLKKCCDYIMVMLQPKSVYFSKSGAGACLTCSGEGKYLHKADPNLMIADWNKSIEEGAIENILYGKDSFCKLLNKLNIDTSIPLKKLAPREIDIVFYGEDKVNEKNQEISYNGLVNLLNSKLQFSKDCKIALQKNLKKFYSTKVCLDCDGSGLNLYTRMFKFNNRSIADLEIMSISDLVTFFVEAIEEDRNLLVNNSITEIINHLKSIEQIGLGYLSLNRKSNTLSGGELQRVRLTNYLRSDLVGLIYILDEPSIGLHPRDTNKIISVLKKLCDLGNTVVVVEHDLDIVKAADYVIEIGPGAGFHGGEVVIAGNLCDVLDNERFLTGSYINQKNRTSFNNAELSKFSSCKWLTVGGARENNLKNITIKFPLGCLIAVTGVSGSGKSTLVHEILYKKLYQQFHDHRVSPGKHEFFSGLEHISDICLIDQQTIGKSSRSNIATYLDVYDRIRQIMSKQELAKKLNIIHSHFSFNTPGGRCEECAGIGSIYPNPELTPEYFTICPSCQGNRFKQEILAVKYQQKNIQEILKLTVEEAISFFSNENKITEKLQLLTEVGLDYITLGQATSTLSGGECQRLKLASKLSERKKGDQILFLFDEPTTGLHIQDIQKLLKCFNKLIESGNTVIIIEHQIELIKHADYIIDLGPEGGKDGGYLVACGTVSDIIKCKESFTGIALSDLKELKQEKI
ncbi:MAG: excinuclease ABC subunit UvrA [Candidatus Delongbacteria bacterium]|nr:excinuclease ABC subunit UvrA [Candidatus Delongbacteria bacterium]MBN2836397.1 excinuclease ABC subunit UvrA [Candidatus Delongbacteria bacterium]